MMDRSTAVVETGSNSSDSTIAYLTELRDDEVNPTLAAQVDQIIETNRGIVAKANAVLPKGG